MTLTPSPTPHPTLTTTPATAADIPALVAFVNSVYRGDSSRQGWTSEADLLDGPRIDAESLQEMLQAQGATLLMARTAAGELVGSVYLQQQADTLYLGMLSVSPVRQRAGIGKYLLQIATDYAREIGCGRLKITVLSVRTELLAWYERHGYRRTGEALPFHENPAFGTPRQPLTLLGLEKAVGNS